MGAAETLGPGDRAGCGFWGAVRNAIAINHLAVDFWRFGFVYWILYGFWPLEFEPWHENAIWMGPGALIADDWIHISFDGHWWWQSGRAADDASWKNHHQAVATSSGFGLLIAVPSVVSFFFVDIEAASRPHYSLGAWILWSLD